MVTIDCCCQRLNFFTKLRTACDNVKKSICLLKVIESLQCAANHSVGVYGHKSIQILTHHLNSHLNCMKCLMLVLNKTFISEMDGNGLGAWCKEPEPVGCSSVLNIYILFHDSWPLSFL